MNALLALAITYSVPTPLAYMYNCLLNSLSFLQTECIFYYMQMVAFAKDPKGENVFSKSKTISAHSTNGTYGIDGRQPTCVTTMDNPLKGNESTDTEVL